MLTVLFSTRNRAEILSKVLEHYCRLQEPKGGWRLVIVDNGSRDQTREVIRYYQNRLPLTHLLEPQPGKNVALNTGLASISGDLVFFTDDDVFPHVDWLIRMRAAADMHPGYAIFAGVVVPKWEILPDPWVLTWVPLAPVFTISNPAVLEGPTGCDNIFGPNMVIRAEIFTRGYRFDPQIGPRVSSYAMGSESEFIGRLIKQGFAAWYCTGAIVEHFIPSYHLRMSWILRRAIRFGRGQYRLTKCDQGQTFPSVLGIPRYIFGQMLTEQTRILIALLIANREKLFHARWQLNYWWGQAIEAHIMQAEAPCGGEIRSSTSK